MCKICSRIGNRYADQLTISHRFVVDAARRACNFPKGEITNLMRFGGLSFARLKEPTLADSIDARTLIAATANPQLRDVRDSSALASPIMIFAFETLNDEWPDRSIFEELLVVGPNAVIMRILHRTGNVQYLSVSEAIDHFACIAIAA